MQCGIHVEFLNFTVTLKEKKSQRIPIKVLTMVMGKRGQSQDDRGILHITHTVGRVICNSSNGALQQILYFHQQIDFLHFSTTKNNVFFFIFHPLFSLTLSSVKTQTNSQTKDQNQNQFSLLTHTLYQLLICANKKMNNTVFSFFANLA